MQSPPYSHPDSREEYFSAPLSVLRYLASDGIRRRTGNHAVVFLLALLALSLPAPGLPSCGGLSAATSSLPAYKSPWLPSLVQKAASPLLEPLLAHGSTTNTWPNDCATARHCVRTTSRLRGGLGSPAPEPWSYAAAIAGCQALTSELQGGVPDDEDDMYDDIHGYKFAGDQVRHSAQASNEEEDDDDREGRHEMMQSLGRADQWQPEPEDGGVCVAEGADLGRGYVGDGVEWVSGARGARSRNGGSTARGVKSYQIPVEAGCELGARGSQGALRPDGLLSKQSWEMTGEKSLFSKVGAGSLAGNGRPPPLLPLSVVFGAHVRKEGEENDDDLMLRTKGSCVPRDEIFSQERELIEIWRDGNELLLPHFARLEQSKKFPGGVPPTRQMGEAAETGNNKHKEVPTLTDTPKGRHPILTPMPSPDKLLSLLPPGSIIDDLNGLGYAELLNRTITRAREGSSGIGDPGVINSGWAINMLRHMATRRGKTQLTDASVDASTSISNDHDSWRRRPWLEDNYTSPFVQEEMGPVETPQETAERRQQTTVAVLGTGRQGKALARVWAQGGFHVLIGSRDYTRGKLAAGEVSRLTGTHVEGGKVDWAAMRGDIIVLATPFCETADMLVSIRPLLTGKGKVVLDLTNPEYDSQSIESTAGVEIHRAVLGCLQTHWAVGYKSAFAKKLTFGPQGQQTVDVCGDEEARVAVCDLIRSHSWLPRVRGGLEHAKDLEPGRRVAYIQQMYGTS